MSLDVSGTTVSILCVWMGPTLGGAEEEETLDTGGSGLPHTAPPDTAGSTQDPAGVVSFYFVFFFLTGKTQILIPQHGILRSHAVALCDSFDLVRRPWPHPSPPHSLSPPAPAEPATQ